MIRLLARTRERANHLCVPWDNFGLCLLMCFEHFVVETKEFAEP